MFPDGWMVFDEVDGDGGFEKCMESSGACRFEWFSEIEAEKVGICRDVGRGDNWIGRGLGRTGKNLSSGVFVLDHRKDGGNTVADGGFLSVQKLKTDITLVFLHGISC